MIHGTGSSGLAASGDDRTGADLGHHHRASPPRPHRPHRLGARAGHRPGRQLARFPRRRLDGRIWDPAPHPRSRRSSSAGRYATCDPARRPLPGSSRVNACNSPKWTRRRPLTSALCRCRLGRRSVGYCS
jgi:hypothetical protein